MAPHKHTLVFYYPRNREAAEAKARALKAAGHAPQLRSLKGWNGYVEEPARYVVVDDAAADVLAAYQKAGTAGEFLTGAPVEAPPVEEPKPAELPHGYSIEKRAQWFALMGPDGQVGKARRTPEDAAAEFGG